MIIIFARSCSKLNGVFWKEKPLNTFEKGRVDKYRRFSVIYSSVYERNATGNVQKTAVPVRLRTGM